MDVISGLKKRCLAPSIAVAAQIAAAKPAAKKPTTTDVTAIVTPYATLVRTE